MNERAARPGPESSAIPSPLREAAREISGYWWVSLVAGIAWLVISAVILQFDEASVTTVGVLVGLMFLLASIQNLTLASAPREALESAGVSGAWRWVSGLFAVLFLIAAVIAFISPENTFAALADTLGFLFFFVGMWWIVRAFGERGLNEFWWLGLISGILMTVLAFWTAGQFFIDKVYLLLVFAGIWALMEGVVDVVRAFEIRRLREGP
jgi:uncharacterized membrane protein HdeD (DUF308 family)